MPLERCKFGQEATRPRDKKSPGLIRVCIDFQRMKETIQRAQLVSIDRERDQQARENVEAEKIMTQIDDPAADAQAQQTFLADGYIFTSLSPRFPQQS